MTIAINRIIGAYLLGIGWLVREIVWVIHRWQINRIKAKLSRRYKDYRTEDPRQDTFLASQLERIEQCLDTMELAARSVAKYDWIERETTCKRRKHRCRLSTSEEA